MRTSAGELAKPRAWNKARLKDGKTHRVFCASLADVFDNEVPTKWRNDLFTLMWETPALTWLLLTKRIGNARHMLPFTTLRNVWLGATIVNQEEADRDVPKLLATPAAKRFISYEPALGPVDWSEVSRHRLDHRRRREHARREGSPLRSCAGRRTPS
jgi:protein gp37